MKWMGISMAVLGGAGLIGAALAGRPAAPATKPLGVPTVALVAPQDGGMSDKQLLVFEDERSCYVFVAAMEMRSTGWRAGSFFGGCVPAAGLITPQAPAPRTATGPG